MLIRDNATQEMNNLNSLFRVRLNFKMSYFLHLLCRRDGSALKGLSYNKETKTYITKAWDFSKEEADKLMGGSLFLHEEKNKPSTIGGIVIDIFLVTLDENDPASRKDRIAFKFEPKLEMKGAKWKGDNHAIAWNSGIHLEEKTD